MEAKKEWKSIHSNYSNQDWVNKPSLFAEEIISLFPKKGKMLEIGGGLGQDSIFFTQRGYEVLLTDHSKDALDLAQSKIAEAGITKSLKTQELDAAQLFPFKDSSFDIVYAHLSLHYFDSSTTHRIFSEINRILKPGGVIAALFNSASDSEYGTGEKIEEGYFLIHGVKKRFFSTDSLSNFIKEFNIMICDNKGETYKDKAKGIHNLIRFVGRKI